MLEILAAKKSNSKQDGIGCLQTAHATICTKQHELSVYEGGSAPHALAQPARMVDPAVFSDQRTELRN